MKKTLFFEKHFVAIKMFYCGAKFSHRKPVATKYFAGSKKTIKIILPRNSPPSKNILHQRTTARSKTISSQKESQRHLLTTFEISEF